MPVIKQQVLPTRPSPFSMHDIEQQATDMLMRARRQADAIIAEAQREAEVLRHQWHDEGFESGRIAGFEYGQEAGQKAGEERAFAEHAERVRLVIDALNLARQQLAAHLHRVQSEAVDEVMQLSFALAKKVIKRLASHDPAVLRANVVEAMNLVAGAKSVRIAVHPSQRADLEAHAATLSFEVPHFEHASIVEDSSIEPGGCRVMTAQGSIDADLNVQFDRIVADLVPRSEAASPADVIART
jgi:flagellar assembly protein FliH